MEEDNESQKVIFLQIQEEQGNQIFKLQKNVELLKTKLRKLQSRVETFDLLAFQQQLDALNDQVKEWSKELIASNRNVAMNCVSLTFLKVQQVIDKKHIKVLAQLIAELGKINERISTSDNPLDVAQQFEDDVSKLVASSGVKGVDLVL
jgi:predicted RNase H-like nuclease (RuvC/YqgF family)